MHGEQSRTSARSHGPGNAANDEPTTAQELLDALRDPRTSAGDLARIVERDESIASNVIALSNSARFAGRFRTASVRDAIVRIGVSVLFSLIVERYAAPW